jgi:hypothetical protein
MLHFKNLWTTCASAFLVALLAGAAHADTARQEFTAALQKWQAAGIHDYRFTLNQSCFCMGVQPVRITVRHDTVQSALRLPDGAAVTAEALGRLPSMDVIFQKIEEAYAKPADHITLSLNPDNGYPERVYIDYVEMMADEELSYTISDFTH